MTINKQVNGNELSVELIGRLDTNTVTELETALSDLSGVNSLNFDFKSLEYISSAGLRLLLSMQKIMNKQGKMLIKNVNADVMEVFEITGFIDILSIE